MKTNQLRRGGAIALLLSGLALALSAHAGEESPDRDHDGNDHRWHGRSRFNVQVGPRPFYLVEGMDDSALKRKLQQCESGPFYQTKFSISHRGAPLEFPEHSHESYEAAHRMGVGILECDVSFTKDGQFVCRHSECDLHTTTNIVATPLNQYCSVPWTAGGPAPKCCTSDITLDQFKSLRAKMDASNPAATTAEGYLGGTPNWRTDLYTGRPAGNVVTLKEHIQLVKQWGISQTPELKAGDPVRIKSIFGSQSAYAQKLIDTYREAHVDPRKVYLQSFNADDVLYWVNNDRAFGEQAMFLDPIDPGSATTPAIPRLTVAQLTAMRNQGVTTFAPPMWALLAVDSSNRIVPSQYAIDIKAAGFKIVAWSFERVNLTKGAAGVGSYYQFDPQGKAVKKDSDMMKALDVLARQVGVSGMFSDWPGTVTYYANCMGL